jgi:hypothetical protein
MSDRWRIRDASDGCDPDPPLVLLAGGSGQITKRSQKPVLRVQGANSYETSRRWRSGPFATSPGVRISAVRHDYETNPKSPSRAQYETNPKPVAGKRVVANLRAFQSPFKTRTQQPLPALSTACNFVGRLEVSRQTPLRNEPKSPRSPIRNEPTSAACRRNTKRTQISLQSKHFRRLLKPEASDILLSNTSAHRETLPVRYRDYSSLQIACLTHPSRPGWQDACLVKIRKIFRLWRGRKVFVVCGFCNLIDLDRTSL